MQAAHQPGELAEAALRPGPAGRQDLGLEHDLGVGDIGQVDGLAGRQLDRRTAQAAGDRHLVDPERSAVAGAGDLDGMGADADRDRQRPALLVGALREQPHVVGRDDIDAGEALLLDDETVDAAVDAELGIARDHHAGGDHRPAVVDRGHRNRQLVEIDFVADQHDLARGRGLEVLRRNRTIDRLLELFLDLPVGLAAERHHGALARADDAGHHRHVVADHLVEIERGRGLIDERGDVADVDGLMQVGELAALPQAIEELTEILLHRGTPDLVARMQRSGMRGHLAERRCHPGFRCAPSGLHESRSPHAAKRNAGLLAAAA